MQESEKQKRKLAFTKFKDKRRKRKKKEEAVKEKPKGMEGRKKNNVKKTNRDENGNGVLDMYIYVNLLVLGILCIFSQVEM